ncbi:secreted RxLR effector protein 161-like [Salvia splendens]|uniref:secreted RxLR effector protein 161-like n=1 Tax=Salvia splendens TaxID=180675 RepID=UPI001C268358|nr:secreted RxLR effector protein 161-like [Salvia splendens]
MDLLRDAGLLGCKPSSVPLDPVNQLKQDTGNPMKDPSKFRRKIGRLLYLCITRSDITFAVHKLSQYVSKPCDEHWEASEKILRYLKGTPGHDADWAACLDTRRSLTCYCLFLGTSLVSWKAKKQHTISRSSAEVEYRAMAQATCEVVWAKALLGDFGITVEKVVPLFCDNQAAVPLALTPCFMSVRSILKLTVTL